MDDLSMNAMAFDPIAYLNTDGWQAMELGTERIEELLRRLGDPHKRWACIHVAGTNGKGSVCAYVDSVLRRSGYKTGLFTSPAVYSFEERFCINGKPLTMEELYGATTSVRQAAEAMTAEGWDHPTGFELLFAVAALAFAVARCDVAVLEVGMGGRLDATNVISDPDVCVLTPIGLDHQAYLGDTLEAIAAEKSAIIKTGASVVTGIQEPSALRVIEDVADQAHCHLRSVDETSLKDLGLDLNAGLRRFSYRGRAYQIALLGSYQPANAALALEVCQALRDRGWHLDQATIAAGLAETRWPGRFEIVGTEPLIIVDGAHNPAGVESLRASFQDLLEAWEALGHPQPQTVLVLGILADKDYPTMVNRLSDLAATFVTFTPPNDRALSGSVLAETLRAARARTSAKSEDCCVVEARDAFEAVTEAKRLAGTSGIILCAGSLYNLSAIEQALHSA